MIGASVLRVLVDAGTIPFNFWTVSPGLYIGAAAITLLAWGISVKQKKYDQLTVLYAIGLVTMFPIMAMVTLSQPIAALYITVATLVSSAILWFFYRGLNWAVLFGHMLDASATWISIDFFGYGEKHVLPSFLINTFNTAAVMFPLKLLFIIPILWAIDKYSDDVNSANFIKIIIFIVGFGPGIRDIVRILMGV